MKTAVEELSPTRVKLTVEVPFKELEPSLQAAYKKVAQQVRVPGFRPGKVPARIIEQRFGRAVVLEETLNDALPKLYGQAVDETEVFPVSQPEIEVTKIEDGEQVEFTAEVDVRPAFDVPGYEGAEIVVDAAEVSDEDVDAQLDGLRQRFATLTGVDRPAQNGDYVVMDLRAEIDGRNLDEQQAADVSYEVGAGSVLQGLDDALQGMAAGEDKTFRTTLVGGENAGEEADVIITVKSVKEKVLPELDDEFAQLASEFDTLDELKDSIREQARRNKLVDQVVQSREKALEALLDRIEIPLPESALTAEIDARKHNLEHQISESGLSREAYLRLQQTTEEELFAEYEANAAKALKSGFVLDKIVKAEDIGVSEQELTDFVVRRAMQMGVAPNTLAQHLADNNQLPLAMMEIVREKAKTLIGDAAKVTDTAGNEVDLKAIYAELNPEQEAVGVEEAQEGDQPADAPAAAEAREG
ncbi:trigger factor [Microbispora triticiradicis]|uniref:Trigger factor n=3 Tax=Microbispora TaxID=2005 RepID=A0ABY3M3B6_9ACTN|nr:MULTISPECIES: trigger factor [Microbispora]RGA01171.1 trigger factor [Microbispora triticiradicis]TLP56147.1 trigger factor [Microbispora fusca]TYB65516.1 trigger factor [Microbispora tritici]GLW24025.1 trigger factor [Microbispora amethystogenes]